MKNSKVIAFSVSDKFGDIGVTGVCIIIVDKNKTACIDTFLISCRIIGRNIEFVLMDYLINTLKDNGISSVKAKYIKTSKNSQVRDFYDKCSFVPTTITDLLREYVLDINDYKPSKINYIEVINE
jgi:predicted enzyme involved in methoxymalonyl-ACP biosynthesis